MSDEAPLVDASAVTAAIEAFDGPTGLESDPGAQPPAPEGQTPDPAQTPEPDYTAELGEVPDLSDLDPAARAYAETRIKDFQRAFTQKTTEIAPLRQLLEAAGGNAQEIADAVEFAQQVRNDPEAQASLYQALKAHYEAQGTPEAPLAATPEGVTDLSEFDLPPEIAAMLTAAQQTSTRLDAYEAREQAREAENQMVQFEQQVKDNLFTQWDGILEEYPDLADAENYIFALGASTGGDLVAATDMYREMTNGAVAAVYKNAAAVPGGISPSPAGAGSSTEPLQLDTMEDAGVAALEFLTQHMAD